MVNLLFISNSPKMDSVRSNLQPLLKVKIDIVSDFDYGLKDVFEKRPATVFIQEQIAGVTGESVARHIQMLLGSGAPSFIFLHEENSKAKPIKGLFEHLINLSQSDSRLIDDIQSTLKSLLGPQWDKISIPPAPAPAAALSAGGLPSENQDDADKLVDDLLSAIDNFGPSDAEQTQVYPPHDFSAPDPVQEESMTVVSSQQDQLAEMLIETAKKSAEPSPLTEIIDDSGKNKPLAPTEPAPPRSKKRKIASEMPAAAQGPIEPAADSRIQQPAVTCNTDSVPATSVKKAESGTVGSNAADAKKQAQQPAVVSPAEFRIAADEAPVDGIPQDLLLAFEDNYRSQVRARRRNTALIVCVLISVGLGWYLFRNNPQLSVFTSRKTQTAQTSGAPVKPVAQDAVALKNLSAPRKMTAAPLPSFIPQSGLDSGYAAQNPGWERYRGSKLEFRLYRSDARIRALQVLAVPGHAISPELLKSVLTELTGNPEYRVTARENKSGVQITRAKGDNSSDVLIYRNKDVIRAFVVSLE